MNDSNFAMLFFQQSWWLPQIAFFIVAGVAIISVCYFIYKITNAIIDWRRQKIPDNVRFAILKDGKHNIVYLHEDENPLSHDIATALAPQIENKSDNDKD